MRTILRSSRARLALAAAGFVAAVAGIAYGAIPDAAGVIHGCYRTSTDDQKGQLRVVSGPESCRNNELPIEWSVTGPPGDPGPPGPPGEDGEDGEDGDPFSGTFTSPNGQYSLSVTDAGIRLAGLGSTIVLDAAGIRIDSAQALTLRSTFGTSIRASAGLTAESGGGILTLEGPLVRIGTAGCRPAARLGDAIAGTAAPDGSVTGVVAAGTPAVCLG